MNISPAAVNQVMCAAKNHCKCPGAPLDTSKHPCRVCKKAMHGGPCSNGDTDDYRKMLCWFCHYQLLDTTKDKEMSDAQKYGMDFTGDGKLHIPSSAEPPSHQSTQVSEHHNQYCQVVPPQDLDKEFALVDSQSLPPPKSTSTVPKKFLGKKEGLKKTQHHSPRTVMTQMYKSFAAHFNLSFFSKN